MDTIFSEKQTNKLFLSMQSASSLILLLSQSGKLQTLRGYSHIAIAFCAILSKKFANFNCYCRA